MSVTAAATAALALAHATVAQPADERAGLQIVISHVRSTRGHVRVDVCSITEFLKDCVHSGAAPATLGVTTILIRDLPPGVYAVQAYQDENDNHAVDRNALGLPAEGVGFSNDAPIRFGPPSFRNAAFAYMGGDQTIHLRLRHFLG